MYDANYTDDFVITISDDVNIFTCDAGTFTIWCRRAGILFSRVSIDLELFVSTSSIVYKSNFHILAVCLMLILF